MKHLIFVFILGALGALSMAPINFPPAILIGIAVLYQKAQKSTSWRYSALIGFIFSLGYFGFSLYWIGNALLIENNPYWWAWPLAVSGLPIILSLFTAISLSAHYFIKIHTSNIISVLSFIIIMSLSEIARGTFFTGFPWNSYGYTWISVMPVAQVANLYNIYLLTALTVFWAASLGYFSSCQSQKKSKIILLLISIISFSSAYLYGTHQISNYKLKTLQADIIIVQPNVKQSDKWNNDKRPRNFSEIIKLSRSPKDSNKDTTIIIWPETTIAQDILNAPWAINMIKEALNTYSNNVFLITGALRLKDNKHYNSIITFNKSAEIINIYDKSHLVPFGEYMPLSNIINIAPIVGFSGFEKGKQQDQISLNKNLSFNPKICYEIIFPKNNAKKTDFIVNVTNDAWYGDSAGPYQHLVQTQFRAIETHKPVFRAANTGISAFISPLGHVEKAISLNKKDFLTK